MISDDKATWLETKKVVRRAFISMRDVKIMKKTRLVYELMEALE